MSDESKKARGEVLRVIDAHADDILAATDGELLEDAKAAGVDVRAKVERLRGLAVNALAAAGRNRMRIARAALVAYRRAPIAPLGPNAPTAANDAEALTLAARNGKLQSERDRRTLQEDLDELAAFDDAGNKPE